MCKNQFITIAIDGAAGSGKSTTSQAICAKFKYIHVDTGLHYRSFSLFFMNQNISPDLVCAFIKSNEISLSSIIKNSSVYLQINDEYFPPSQLRNESMNKEVSFYARIPEVRSLLLSYQRNLVDYVQKMIPTVLLWMVEILVVLYFPPLILNFIFMQILTFVK